ncbi:hypothetical protein HHL22_16865 [Hymenobacter sp. RP-2-7]|uniref:Uncharacterized protein n=1 Tax=Hymenobacter polaris TaxID=2682546 RepID=A0A7Y0AGJ4_9BACT|nr:hypothetical protein [Hymenobacter polaris]NML66879.1 hypothetical protein [Hymenobacter polaris]
MQPKVTISFMQRGLPGLLCIGLGLALCFIFRHSSAWPEELKHLAFPVALVLALGGMPLVNSYVYQRPWSAMRSELRGLATLLAGLLGWQLCSWLGAL